MFEVAASTLPPINQLETPVGNSHRLSLPTDLLPGPRFRRLRSGTVSWPNHLVRAALLALSLTAPAVGFADELAPGVAIAVTKVWARATTPGATIGVVYFEITNAGGEDELLSMESSIARAVEMHSTQTVAGVMRVHRVGSVPIAAAGHVVFGPGGLHATLIDLTQPLRERDSFPLTLVFRHAGRMQVQVITGTLGALEAPKAVTTGHAAAR